VAEAADAEEGEMTDINATEFGIRELSGVCAGSSASYDIMLREEEATIGIQMATTNRVGLRPATARRLARQLHRMATRIERRLESEA
jgi:predicted component of type VI protein secretion system